MPIESFQKGIEMEGGGGGEKKKKRRWLKPWMRFIRVLMMNNEDDRSKGSPVPSIPGAYFVH